MANRTDKEAAAIHGTNPQVPQGQPSLRCQVLLAVAPDGGGELRDGGACFTRQGLSRPASPPLDSALLLPAAAAVACRHLPNARHALCLPAEPGGVHLPQENL